MIRKATRLLLLLALLFSAFLLHSVTRVREASSVRFPPSPEVSQMALYRHVEALAVRIGSRSLFEYDRLEAAKRYLVAELRRMGHAPALQDYTHDGRVYANVVVTLPGSDPAAGVTVIGAHYDTVAGTPGADDNASAVAILLEICRSLVGYTPERTLKLVFFTLEEPPIFRSESMGSFVFASDAKARGESITAMVSLEMLGYYSDRPGGQSFPVPLMALWYPTTPDFVAVVGNLASRELVRRVSESLKNAAIPVETLTTVPFVPGVDFSDHRSFWKMGYPAVMVTDTAFFRNPNYHTEGDTIDTLDFGRMGALVPGLVAMAKRLSTR